MNFTNARGGLLAALIAGALLFTACDTGNTPQDTSSAPEAQDFASVDMSTAEISAAGLAEHLLASVQFDDPNLIQMDAEIAQSLYNVAGLADSVVSYGSTGATAEAVLVMHCTSAENAAAAADKIGKYRTEMAAIYADYNEPESAKLTRALLAQDGVYVVFCVSPDTAAAESAYHDFVVTAVYGEG